MKNTYECVHFFILSKGNNSGKPMETPCPNCFVCLCKDEEEKQRLYWLFYGLWQGMYFHPFLTGSVIPFIRLDDLKSVVKIALVKIELKPLQFDKNISMVQLLDKKAKVVQEQIKLIKQAKKALMYQALK
ncbi:MAG: hypothetical protein IPM51_06905 [Sphingobacteriaceae bacterium]|nr:hypothetical protein [Sphingobacteriaceae bacterium]